VSFALQIALSGLRAQQQAMTVTGHNIANANTKGYHRQETVFVPGNPLPEGFSTAGVGNTQLGTGVSVTSVKRQQSSYIDQQARTAQDLLGTWEYRREGLSQIESVFSEPGEQGLNSAMDEFWGAWSELSASPESQSAKIAVVESGISLSERITTLRQDLSNMQSQSDKDVVDNVAQINALAKDIAAISTQIKRSEANGYQPNDLLDERGNLLDQLAKIVNIQMADADGSDIMVAISGKLLIQGDLVSEIEVVPNAQGWSKAVWSGDGSDVVITGGQLAGQMQVRDDVLQSYIDSLDDIAGTLVTQVNAYYSTARNAAGDLVGNFFVAGSDASNIAVEPGLVAAPLSLVTSDTGNQGANDVAGLIADLSSLKLASGESINETYMRLVSHVGADSHEAIARTDTYNVMLEQVEAQREAISGVSLDEEMLNMTRFQQAYNAAARMVTALDDMMDTVISRMGTVGR
jgi:flagellar hook-associated protein 1 FlgK